MTNVKSAVSVNIRLTQQLIVFIIGKQNKNKKKIYFEIFSSRRCGEGVCDQCSTGRLPVPERDWLTPERVCKTCESVLTQ